MRIVRAMGLVICLLVCVAQARAAPSVNDALRHDVDSAREKVYPALVNISVVFRYFAEGRAQRSPAGGSGVIISPEGYVVTNFHVAGHTTRIVCTLVDGRQIDAKSIVDDPQSDLSILKLNLNKETAPYVQSHYARLGDSSQVRVGDFVMAMGNPLMLSSSLTLGVVSNTKRVFTDFTGTRMEDTQLERGEKTGMFTRWIQHDALILPGNSGGPLVSRQGDVIGINELGGDGVGFAIPSNLVASVFAQAKNGGKIKRGFLGVNVLPVSKIDRTTGALVSSIVPNSPAAKAGIRPGDIILSLDGTATDIRYFEQVPLFYQQTAAMPEGHHARINLLRNGQTRLTTAVIAPMEKSVGDEEEFRGAGVTVESLTSAEVLADHLPDKNGVEITSVRPGYPFESAQPGITDNDVIRSVDGKPTIAAFRHALAAVTRDQYPVVFLRRGELLVTVVKRDTQKPSEDGGELPQAWLGIKTQVLVPEVATALGLDGTTGFRITEVYPWTEASKAGLMTGDIITSLNGNNLDAAHQQDADDLNHAIEQLTIGDKAEMGILRNGKKQAVKVVLERTPSSAAQAKSVRQKEFEFTVREITDMDRIDRHWTKSQRGMLVTEVTSGSWAQMSGLHIDDLIVSINDQPVTTVDGFTKLSSELLRKHPRVVRIFVQRDYLTHFVFIEPDWSKLAASE